MATIAQPPPFHSSAWAEPAWAAQRNAQVAPPDDHSLTEPQFDALLEQVFVLIGEESKRATWLWGLAIQSERQWKTQLTSQLEAEHEQAQCWGHRAEQTRLFSDLLTPLSTFAGGLASVLSTGFSPVALGAIALGGLMTLDKVAGDPAKKMMAAALAQKTGEEPQTWLQRIAIFTGLASISTQLGLFGATDAPQLITGLSSLAVEGTRTLTDWKSQSQEARLLGLGKQWDDSGRRLHELIGAMDRHVQMVDSFFKMLSSLQHSTTQTVSALFR